jgi:hypothetical protein
MEDVPGVAFIIIFLLPVAVELLQLPLPFTKI